MPTALSVESLEARLIEIEKERELLLQLIAIHKGEAPKEGRTVSMSSPRPGSNTIRGRVVDAAIELVHMMSRNVSNEEVLEFVQKKGISLGTTTDEVRTIAAILSKECSKKSAKL